MSHKRTAAEKARRAEYLRRMLLAADLPEAIRRAYFRRDVTKLAEILRSEVPLSSEQRDALAAVLERRVAVQPKHRPPDALPSSAAADMERHIAFLVRRAIDAYRAQEIKIWRGVVDDLINYYLALRAENGDLHGLNISIANIRDQVRRGRLAKPAKG